MTTGLATSLAYGCLGVYAIFAFVTTLFTFCYLFFVSPSWLAVYKIRLKPRATCDMYEIFAAAHTQTEIQKKVGRTHWAWLRAMWKASAGACGFADGFCHW